MSKGFFQSLGLRIYGLTVQRNYSEFLITHKTLYGHDDMSCKEVHDRQLSLLDGYDRTAIIR